MKILDHKDRKKFHSVMDRFKPLEPWLNGLDQDYTKIDLNALFNGSELHFSNGNQLRKVLDIQHNSVTERLVIKFGNGFHTFYSIYSNGQAIPQLVAIFDNYSIELNSWKVDLTWKP